jgi:hypothetical protein
MIKTQASRVAQVGTPVTHTHTHTHTHKNLSARSVKELSQLDEKHHANGEWLNYLPLKLGIKARMFTCATQYSILLPDVLASDIRQETEMKGIQIRKEI